MALVLAGADPVLCLGSWAQNRAHCSQDDRIPLNDGTLTLRREAPRLVCAEKDRDEQQKELILSGDHQLYEQELTSSMMFSQCDVLMVDDLVWRSGNFGWDGFVSIFLQGTAKSLWKRGRFPFTPPKISAPASMRTD